MDDGPGADADVFEFVPGGEAEEVEVVGFFAGVGPFWVDDGDLISGIGKED